LGRNDDEIEIEIEKKVLKGVKGIESMHVIAMMGNIKFEIFPVTP